MHRVAWDAKKVDVRSRSVRAKSRPFNANLNAHGKAHYHRTLLSTERPNDMIQVGRVISDLVSSARGRVAAFAVSAIVPIDNEVVLREVPRQLVHEHRTAADARSEHRRTIVGIAQKATRERHAIGAWDENLPGFTKRHGRDLEGLRKRMSFHDGEANQT